MNNTNTTEKTEPTTNPRLSRRGFLKAAVRTSLSVAVLGTGGLLYANEIEPRWVEVTQVVLTLPRLDRAFDGYRLVQLSDIHADDWMTASHLSACIELVNQQQPDMVVLTGDFVTHHAEGFVQTLTSTLPQIRSHDGSLAVLGNHDHWTNPTLIRQALQESGVINVSNDVYTLQRGDALLHVAGVDDIWEEQDRLDLVLERLPAQGAAVLLAHEPDFADESAATGRFDLQLSGHSHGGQVKLPFVGRPILPYLGEKYPVGLYQVGSMLQYTNRGLGGLRLRIRFQCRPEITVLTLHAVA